MEPETSTALEQLCKSIQTFGSLSMAAESRDKLYQYQDALMQSLRSIMEDTDCDETAKVEYFNTSLEQYTAAMKELFPKLISVSQPVGNQPASKQPAVIKADSTRYDVIDEVEKFNPYHDARGRFATANSHTFFTVQTKDPSKQHMADAAIAREKERDKQGLVPGGKTPEKKPKAPKKETKPSDPLNNPSSIAGVERGDPMTRSQANNNRVNPNYFKAPGYQTNCQSCVVAYEARLRGYDVQTKANTRGSKLDVLSRDTRLAWIDPATGKKPDWITSEKVTTAKRCKTWMEETIKPGERYTFQHGWKGRSRTGHIISADKDSDGNLRLYDPQNGKTMQGADIDAYLSRAKFTTTVYGTKIPRARLIRVDNMQFNPDMADGIMEAKKTA